jgi:diguanylate cyclase (GGDEF)-like protein
MIRASTLPAVPERDNEERAAVAERLGGFGRLWLMLRGMVAVNVVVMAANMLAIPDVPWRLLPLVALLALANEAQLSFARRARTLAQLEWRLFASALLLLVGGFIALHALGEALGVLALAMVVAAYSPVLRARSSLGLAAIAASMLLIDVVAVRTGLTLLPGVHVDVGVMGTLVVGLVFAEIAVISFLGTQRVHEARERAQRLLTDLQSAQQRLSQTNHRLERWNEELNREVARQTAALASRERRSGIVNSVTASISQALADDTPFDAALALLGSMFDACVVQVYFAPADDEKPAVQRCSLHDHADAEVPRNALLDVTTSGMSAQGELWIHRDGALVCARYAVVPLTVKGRARGSFGLLVEGEWEITEDDLDVLAAVGRELAAAMEHRREFRDALARANREALLNNVARVLDETLDTSVALTRALRNVAMWLGAAEAAVVTRARGSRRMEVAARVRTPGLAAPAEGEADAIERLFLTIPHVVEDRADAMLLGPGGEDEISAEVAALGVGSILVVPLLAHRLAVGAVVILTDGVHRWGPAQREVAARLAQQLNARFEADEVVRLQARRISELSGLARIGEVVQSTVDPVRLFRGFARTTAEIVPFRRMFIAQLPEDEGLLRVQCYDAEGRATPVPAEASDAHHRWVTLRAATLIEELDGAPPSFLAGVESPLVVPMRPKGELLGVVAIEPVSSFDIEQLPLVAQAVSQLASERAARIQVLGNLARVVASVVDLRDAFDAFADEVRWLIPFEHAAMFRLDATAQRVEPYAAYPADTLATMGACDLDGSLVWAAYHERGPVRLRRGDTECAEWQALGDPAEVALVPVMRGDDCVAVLALGHTDPEGHGYTRADIDALQEVGRLLAVTIERVELFEQAEHTARHDVLTGLPNARYLQEQLVTAGIGAPGTACAVLMLDMDNLKVFNDTLGHAIGDQVITRVGEVVRSAVRTGDFVARVGGDEFVALIDGAGADEAQMIATRIHDALRVLHQRIPGAPMDVRVSIGLACAPDDAVTADDLMHAADVAMYAAKFAGGGRTASATGSMPDQRPLGHRGRPDRLSDSIVRAATAAAAPREREGVALAQRYALATALRMGVPAHESEVLRMLVARNAAQRLVDARPGLDQALSAHVLDALASEWAGRDPQSAAVAQVVADTAVQLAWLQLPEPFGAGCGVGVAIERLAVARRQALEVAVLQEMGQAIRIDDAGGLRLRAA